MADAEDDILSALEQQARAVTEAVRDFARERDQDDIADKLDAPRKVDR